MSYELFIAKRHFYSKRRTGFISLVNYFSIVGVAIGVAALIIVLSVMNGFETEIRSRIIGFDTHIKLTGSHSKGITNSVQLQQKIKKYNHVVEVSPFILNKGMIINREYSDAIIIKGVDPKLITKISNLDKNINYGELNLDTVWVENEKPLSGIVLGTNIALRLDVNLNDKIWLYCMPRDKRSIFSLYKQQQNCQPFRVTGFFETGLHEFDNFHGFISITSAQKLLKMTNTFSGLEIMIDKMDISMSQIVAQQLKNDFKDKYKIETWFDRNKNLFSSMQFEKWAAFIILSLIVLVAAFNIVNNLIMIVMEKKQEIGILKSIGAPSNSIMKIFLFQGLISGLIGTIAGCTLGYLFCKSQQHFQWFSLNSDVYFINALPVEIKIWDIIIIGAAATILCIIAALYPSWKASKLNPIEAIRYE